SLAFTSCSDDDNNPTPDRFELVRDDFQGEIKEGEVVLTSGTYKMTGKVIVGAGATLTIKPGVTIEATNLDPNSNRREIRYIAVAQGGKINVEGTRQNPVVMTAATKTPGAWGGLVICGRAPINVGASAAAEVSGLTYGGTLANDNSGSIKYLRIEYSGYSYSAEKEFNGLSMFGVGKGTTIEYVQVHEGSDDGFEWFGGTVDSKYLVATANEDDQFDWTEGWNGTNENWYAKEASAKGNRGIEADNNSNTHDVTPTSNPTIKNLTLIGRGAHEGESQAIKLRVGTKGMLDNVVLSNWGTGFDVEHDVTIGYVGSTLKATRVKFDNIATKSKGKKSDGSSVDVASVFTEDGTATGAGAG